MDTNDITDNDILVSLGQRLRRLRLDANLTRDQLAAAVGLSADTVRNAESGQNISLETLIRILRGLDQLADFAPLLQSAGPSPVQLAKTRGRLRQRASGTRKSTPSGDWEW